MSREEQEEVVAAAIATALATATATRSSSPNPEARTTSDGTTTTTATTSSFDADSTDGGGLTVDRRQPDEDAVRVPVVAAEEPRRNQDGQDEAEAEAEVQAEAEAAAVLEAEAEAETDAEAEAVAILAAGELIESLTFAHPQSILQQTLQQLLGMIQKQSIQTQKQSVRMDELETATNDALVEDRNNSRRMKEEEEEARKEKEMKEKMAVEEEEKKHKALIDRLDELEGRMMVTERNDDDDEEEEKQKQQQQQIRDELKVELRNELKEELKEELRLELNAELASVTASISTLTGRVASCETTCTDLRDLATQMDERHGRSIEDMDNRLNVVAYDLGFHDDDSDDDGDDGNNADGGNEDGDVEQETKKIDCDNSNTESVDDSAAGNTVLYDSKDTVEEKEEEGADADEDKENDVSSDGRLTGEDRTDTGMAQAVNGVEDEDDSSLDPRDDGDGDDDGNSEDKNKDEDVEKETETIDDGNNGSNTTEGDGKANPKARVDYTTGPRDVKGMGTDEEDEDEDEDEVKENKVSTDGRLTEENGTDADAGPAAAREDEEDASLDLRILLAGENSPVDAAAAEATAAAETSAGALSRRDSAVELDVGLEVGSQASGSNGGGSIRNGSNSYVKKDMPVTNAVLPLRRAPSVLLRRRSGSRRLSIAHHASSQKLDYDQTLLSRLERLEESYDAMHRHSADGGDNGPAVLQEEVASVTQRVDSIEHFLDGYVVAGDNCSDNLSAVLQERDEQIKGDLDDRFDPLSRNVATSAGEESMSTSERPNELETPGAGDSKTPLETVGDRLNAFKREVEESFRMVREQKADISTVMQELQQSEQRLAESLGSQCSSNHSSAVESIRQLRENMGGFAAASRDNTSTAVADPDGNDSRLQEALAIVDASQAAIKSLEHELEALVSKLSEKPDLAQVKGMIESLEASNRDKLEKDEALTSLIETLTQSLAQKMTRNEVKAAIKKAVEHAKLGLNEKKSALMIGQVRYCLGCNSPHPGVNGSVTKVTHNALPGSRSGRTSNTYQQSRRYFHVSGSGSGSARLSRLSVGRDKFGNGGSSSSGISNTNGGRRLNSNNSRQKRHSTSSSIGTLPSLTIN